jgi:hypothetical protein
MIYCNSKLGNIVIKALILTWISFISISPTLFCQDLTTIKSASPVKVTGSFYSAFNYTFSDASIPPAGFNTGINVNFNFYNAINIPLSFAYSNYGSSVNTISFNRFGISPSYKSLKIHAGHRSYVLSPYLMSGLTVLGGGIELNPKKFYFLAFYGKVNDPYFVGNDVLTLRNDGFDFFNRKAYGFKLGFGKSTNRIGIALFHAKDDLLTGSIDTLAKYNINGKENVGIGLDLTQQFFKIVTLSGNAAVSILTNDLNGEAIRDSNATQWVERVSFLTTINQSSRYSFAYDGKISFKIKTFNLGVKYQHIDPFYSSLGISYLQTNFDNYLMDINGSLFKSKLNLSSNFGLQYVNKSGFTGLPQKRIVANVNTNVNFTKELNLNVNYSNLVQNTNPTIQELNDSLLFTTNNVGWNGTLSYKIGKGKEKPHIVSFNSSNTTFDVLNNDQITLSSVNTNYNLNYRYQIKNGWSFGGGIQYFVSENNLSPSLKRKGFLLNVGKKISESLNFRVNTSFRSNETQANKDGYIINGNVSLTYQIKKKHNFSLNTSQLIRKTTLIAAKNETRFRVNYNYNF